MKIGKTLRHAAFVLFCGFTVMAILGCSGDPERHFKAEPVEGKSAGIVSYAGSKWSVDIPSRYRGLPVKYIGDDAFSTKNLVKVRIPSGVEAIFDNAFFGNQLTKVSIPGSVTYIGEGAFSGNLLASVRIPGKIMTIEPNVFSNNMIKSVTIPSNITSIGARAFEGNQLSGIVIPANVTYIGDKAFHSNLLESATIGNNVVSIGDEAFGNNKLTMVIIPENVAIIGNGAFADNKLISITLSQNVTGIGNYAFLNNSLASVTIPANVTVIGSGAFGNNSGLSSFTFASGSKLETIGGRVWNDRWNAQRWEGMGAFEGTNISSITIPETVTNIGNGAFNGWTEAQTIRIPFATIAEANRSAAQGGWGTGWRAGNNATILNNAGEQISQ
ncbi:MAG: leucine-rich repeat domain-containing protein [Treponema sp.]|nr:leucine-rich repeat domain-containing protein [Treponema sp.]MCL2237373.1 leucine-rich repeat domain-containing protein [Treponema sp.]